jgi:hypothetical protein
VSYRPRWDWISKTDKSSVIFVHGLFGHPYKTWTYKQKRFGRKRRKQWKDKLAFKRNVGPVNEEEDEDSVSEDDFLVDLDKADSSDNDGSTQNGHVKNENREENGQTQNQSSDVYWPRDLLPERLPNARIFTWGYDANIENMFSSASRASIFQHAGTFLEDIAGVRETLGQMTRPLVFVVHSLGGIVVKEALCASRIARSHINATFSATVGVAFLGTPHRGSSTATLGKIAFEVSKVSFKSPNLQVLRSLEKNSEHLGKIGWAFTQLMEGSRIGVHSFGEELTTKGMMVVDNNSSTMGHAFETASGIHANHSNMTKFKDATDSGLIRVTNVLRGWAKEKFNPSDADERACIASLNVPQARERIHHVEGVFKDTYEWLFGEKTSFAKWLTEERVSGIYWVQGKPGSGKSTMMKFALRHTKTRRLLLKNRPEAWIIAGFFFHDRGTAIQKTIEGLLCEILYQLITQNRELVRFFYPVYLSEVKPENTAGHFGKQSHGSQINRTDAKDVLPHAWPINALRNAFMSISRQQKVKANICLFVDALDEHMGNHRELLRLLTDFADTASRKTVHVKLCLASRPETVFLDALQGYPGFAIHQRTAGDIEAYVLGGLQHELSKQHSSFHDLRGLVDDLIKKASGVFIWVKLVVNELVEGLCDGSTISELRILLESIPSEIEDLYHRILTRINPRYRYEAFIMFQIALYSWSACSLQEFIRRSHYLCSNNLETASEGWNLDTMSRRLTSRSGGLLEINMETADRRPKVNFLHQTAKEFTRQESLLSILVPHGALIDRQHGHVLLFSYCCALLEHGLGSEAQDFVYHAQLAEKNTGMAQTRKINQIVCGYKSKEPLKL